MFQSRRLRMLEAALVWLFFIQAWRALNVATFTILYDRSFEKAPGESPDALAFISVGLIALALAAPLAAPRRFARLSLALAAVCAAGARPALNAHAAMTHYWGALVVLAAGSIYLTVLARQRSRTVVVGLVGALAADQFLRALGYTCDPGVNPAWLLPFSLLALVLAIVSLVLFVAHPQEALEAGQFKLAGGLALGAAMFIETSLLSLPNAVARWSDFEYAVVAPVFLAATGAPLFIQVRRRAGQILSRSRWVGLALILAALAGLALGYQRAGLLSAGGLLAAHVALLLALFQAAESNPARRRDRTGLWLALGLWLMLALTIALNWAFAYAYTLAFMRDMGLPVYLLAGVLAAQAALTCSGSEPPAREPAEYRRMTGGLMAALGGAALAVAAASFPLPARLNEGQGPLTVVTYTIRYGYDTRWHYRLDEIARAIEQAGADVVTLQEVDTGRLSSYGADDVLYLARRLRMQAVYLPTVERLTGLAILHRLPEAGREARLLTSLKEQTGVLRVHLRPGGRDLHVYGTWLGIRGENTLQQTDEILQFIGDETPAVLGGAFFAGPGSDVYAKVSNAGFDFVALGLGAPLPTLEQHVDYIWTRGVTPARGWTPPGPAMNHAMVAVTFDF